jgi:hypothetical protein
MATKAATLKTDDQSTPAVRATDPERAQLQRELLEEFPVLREQVREASAAIEKAKNAVHAGTHTQAFIDRAVERWQPLARRLNQIQNDNARRLRDLCRDDVLIREERRLLQERNRLQDVVQELSQPLEKERLAFGRLKRQLTTDFGLEGGGWQLTDETTLEVLSIREGNAHAMSDQQRRALVAERTRQVRRAAEELALLEADFEEARERFEEAARQYERNRMARTWSVL